MNRQRLRHTDTPPPDMYYDSECLEYHLENIIYYIFIIIDIYSNNY